MAPRVLVIDDSPMTVALLSQALAGAGLEVNTATDLAQLDARLAEHTFSLVLVDVNMPEMYGDDVVEFLRHQRQIKAQLFLYSDLPEDELAGKADKAGADGYIAKSYGLEAAVEKIVEAVSESAVAVAAPAPAPVAAQPAKRRVLVVDDSESTAKLLEAELTAKGHDVMTAHSADAATKIILKKKTRPDLVLLDVHMPGVNGEEFCRFIKGNSLFAGIQVVLCSAEEETELKRIVQAAGADGYVRKDSLIAREILDLLT